MLDPSRPFVSPLTQLPLGGHLKAEDLEKMATRGGLPTGGSEVSLADLSNERPRLFRIHPGGPPEALLLTTFQWSLLRVICRPNHLRSHGVNAMSSYYMKLRLGSPPIPTLPSSPHRHRPLSSFGPAGSAQLRRRRFSERTQD